MHRFFTFLFWNNSGVSWTFNDRTILAEIAIEALEKKREIEKELEKYRGRVRHRVQLSQLSEGLKNRLGKLHKNLINTVLLRGGLLSLAILFYRLRHKSLFPAWLFAKYHIVYATAVAVLSLVRIFYIYLSCKVASSPSSLTKNIQNEVFITLKIKVRQRYFSAFFRLQQVKNDVFNINSACALFLWIKALFYRHTFTIAKSFDILHLLLECF